MPGTGVVTSVPSDAPDDFAALRDLKKKEVGLLHYMAFTGGSFNEVYKALLWRTKKMIKYLSANFVSPGVQ